ncbi:STY4534 family ICE replication protein [Ectothiorhodospira variabilis]|uniref:STY4534 family ICE replication protein n=1 Tax=Ectothiorhodospira variabilis TaxID=505694 RepID=UPI001EFB62C1|nr:STY4534 family ICE replication protein [Ectothiorhodospira variabilis]MCG5495531.1 STY4534 family ICE replication protein [Ectothiorhodospira variabilis]MCG5505139.1 STY4534 family ICE replication protein [Ectothiorhodospira variabilis]MCG5508296.1 STY4534 family ICE replication protein [Ectothiorhodospira variabilis]
MSESQYFDLHINGLGYLNRAREVSVRRGEPFLAVEVNALHGAADDPQYTRFDCRVNGQEAQALIREYLEQINDRGRLAPDGTTLRHKVLAGFRLGDLYPDVFTYQKGPKQGQTGVSLKARLLKIKWLKVDGRMVYKAESEDQAASNSSASEDDPAQTDHPTRPQATESDHQVVDQVAESAPPMGEPDDDLDALLPEEVQLSKDDPEFVAKKERLKSQGYRFDGQTRTWRLPATA